MYPELEVKIGGTPVTLTYDNTWVCLFTEAPGYDHLYVYHPTTFVVFECRTLLDQLMHLGFPMQVRHLPTPWDETAMTTHLHNQAANLDAELDDLESELEEGDEPGVD